jgi:hypothetical protein
MYVSEHSAMPGPNGPTLCCWRGIGLYKWNGTRLTENYVEQDYAAMQAQLASGQPHPLIAPHIDPWTTTEPVPADPANEAVVLAWLERGNLADAPSVEIDDMRTGAAHQQLLDVERVTVNDLFSAGPAVPFHVTMHGAYRGGLGDELDAHVGDAAALTVVGIARTADGSVTHVDAITGRFQLAAELASPAAD